MDSTTTLHDALRETGHGSRDVGFPNKREVFRLSDGEVVGLMSAHEAWSWLADLQRTAA